MVTFQAQSPACTLIIEKQQKTLLPNAFKVGGRERVFWILVLYN